MKEKQAPSQSGLAAAATSKRSSGGVAAGNHLASEVPGTLLPLILLWPPYLEGCMCSLKFTHILPGRKDRMVLRGCTAFRPVHSFRSSIGGPILCFCSHFLVCLSWCCLPVPSACWSPTITSTGNPLLSRLNVWKQHSSSSASPQLLSICSAGWDKLFQKSSWVITKVNQVSKSLLASLWYY